MSFTYLAVFFFVSLVLAQVQPPKWPTQFSSGVDRVTADPPEVGVGIWRYDQSQNADRYDLHVDDRRVVELNRYDLSTRFTLEDRDGRITCTKSSIADNIPSFNFANYVYKGKISIRGRTVDHWQRNTVASSFNYYDDESTQDPVQYDAITGDERSAIHFYDFKAGPQGSAIFNVSNFDRACNGTWVVKENTDSDVIENVKYDNSTDLVGCSQISCALHILDTQGLKAWQTWDEGDCSHWAKCV
eukprot:TRINITY_DN7590_c0_g1_i1.p1 TRINITY_DN7590_c0_g1~~TRINITY_DN7590_c0_g1_i1.p1  ORF type:complete len:244 (-),score=47.36 TRINITY_DN7590_c0_g1_i1:31-762(-)